MVNDFTVNPVRCLNSIKELVNDIQGNKIYFIVGFTTTFAPF